MTRVKIIVCQTTISVLTIIFPAITAATESIFPASYDVQINYDVSAEAITIRDTLIITRSVTNNEDFGLANLYLADNFPLEFTLIDYTLLIDGLAVPAYYSGPLTANDLHLYNAYRWLIDQPSPDDTLNRILSSEETLALRYRLVCSQPGEYPLPFHTLCAYGNNSGIFSTAPTILITILPLTEIEDREPDIPENTCISRAYPNPFNREVVIRYENKTLSNSIAHLIIYDLTGGIVYDSSFGDTGIIHWRPSINVTSGIYFYTISQASRKQTITGKVTLLK